MRVTLATVLARVGLMLSGRGPWARLRSVGLCVGSMVLVLGAASLVLQETYAHQRQVRADQIRPHLASAGQTANLLISFPGFTQLDDRPVAVISIWPLRRDAPLPPGVSRWPEPGEAVVSPAVASDLHTDDPAVFGKLAGVIAPQGLEVPRERRVYLRPTAAALVSSEMQPATGFGRSDRNGFGYGTGLLYAAPPWQVYLLLIATLLIPALVALGVAAGLDGDTRARRNRLLTVLGADARHLSIVDVAEAWPAIAIGTVFGAGLVTLLCAIDVQLPMLDALLSAADARAAWPQLVLAVMIAHSLAIATVLAVRQRNRVDRGGPMFTLRQDRQNIRAAICIIAASTTIWLPGQSDSAPFRMVVYTTGVLIVGVTLPALVGILLATAGERVAEWGTRRGSVGSIVAGRRLQLFPIRTTRLALGVCFSVLILGQVQLWTSQLGSQYYQALRDRADLGATVVGAGNTSYGPGMRAFLDGLEPSIQPVWVSVHEPAAGDPQPTPAIRINASCAALTALNAGCSSTPSTLRSNPSPPLAHILEWGHGIGTVQLIREEVPDLTRLSQEEAQLLLMSTTGQDLPLARLQREAYTLVQGGLRLDTLGQGWVTAGTNLKIRANWTVMLGLIGVAVVVIGTGCAMAGDVITSARESAPLALLTERRRWLIVLACWRTTLPSTLAGTAGALAYLILPAGLADGDSSMTPSITFATASVLICLTLSSAIALLVANAITRRVQPGVQSIDH